jgi:predicted nucleic-acid-binding Zn-ribbon protein
MKNKKHRIILDISKATDIYCGNCKYLEFDGTCRIFKTELNWNRNNMEFYRCEECKFNELENKKEEK